MKNHPSRARAFGYARMSPGEQVPSPEVQRERITKRTGEMEGAGEAKFVRCRVESGQSGKTTSFEERPEFAKLLREVKRGDHLIVFRLDRIDSDPHRLAREVEALVHRGVVLHSLEEKPGMSLDLDTVRGQVILMVWEIIMDLFSSYRSESVRSALQWRKENGMVYQGRPPYGRRRSHLPRRPGQRRRQPVESWDFRECDQIRQIKRRYESGETMLEIGKDFYARKLKTANGKLWVKPYGRQRRLDLGRLYRAYHWYCDPLAEGQDLGGIPAVSLGQPPVSEASLPAAKMA